MTYSQAKQYLWVKEVLKDKSKGLFLDVGCGDPEIDNNSLLLELELGWQGVGVDLDSKWSKEWVDSRDNPFIQSNALYTDWSLICADLGYELDYLSFDIDESQKLAIHRFPWDKIKFKVLTIEHDGYRFGENVRDEIRSVISKAGYKIAKKDVVHNGVAFEDWWINDSFKL